jgi:hypothetical protein
MQFKTLLVGIAAMGLTAAASAATYTSNVNPSGSWTSAGSWTWDQGGSPSTGPGANDKVIIAASDTITVASGVFADSLELQSGAVLAITDGTVLVDGGNDPTHPIDGTIQLGTAMTAGFLFFTANNQTIFGSGSIDGFNPDSEIIIADGRVLTNQMTIEGTLVIDAEDDGSATLQNVQVSSTVGAKVLANAGDTLILGADLLLDDVKFVSGDNTYRPLYKTDGNGSDLVFNFPVTSPELEGDFVVANCGNMHFNQDIETLGNLTHGSGLVYVANGMQFEFANGGPYTYNGGTPYGNCP